MFKRLFAAPRERTSRSRQTFLRSAAMHYQAVGLLGNYQRTSNLDLLNVAIELLRDLLAATSPKHLNRPMYLSNLGAAPPDPATQPTASRVLAELPRHAWVHLSCHGSQHFTDPTASAFWLTGGPLRITDLIEQHHPGPRELAFLFACKTATGSTQAPYEALHLAAATQLMGYRHVIATLWSIYDSTALDIADVVYGALTSTGTPDTSRAARALHNAVTALRAKHPAEPLAWGP